MAVREPTTTGTLLSQHDDYNIHSHTPPQPTTTKEKEVMNLREQMEDYMGGVGQRGGQK